MITTNLVETQQQKRTRLARLGYVPAARPGKCCLCGKGVSKGQYIGKMPDGWQPASRLRWAHRRCREALKAQITAKAERLGVVVPVGGGDAHG
jgi:hypothetical protein